MSGLLKDLSIGADPELFVKDLRTSTFVPSLDLVGGSKVFPRAFSQEGFWGQEDNVLVEYNIPPSFTKEEFVANVRKGIKLFEEFLPPDKYSVEIQTSHKFKPEQLLDPRANQFGCDPDFNAWLDGIENPSPEIPVDGLRCAGGHVHVGYQFADPNQEEGKKEFINQQIVRWQDLLLGVPAMKIDRDTERRKLYGKAGAYRNKPYGVEYRTLSSFWLSSPSLIEWVFNKTKEAVENVSNLNFLDNRLQEKIMAAINHSDNSAIDYLFKEYNLQAA